MEKPYVVTCSVLHMDEYWTIEKWPEEGDKSAAAPLMSVPGGAVANMSCVLASLGTQVQFYDVLSTSRRNDKLLADMEQYGISVDHVRRVKDMKDSKCLIFQSGKERTIIWMARPKKIPKLHDETLELMEQAAYIYCYGGMNVIPHPLEWMSRCRAAGAKFVFDIESAPEDEERERMIESGQVLFFNQFGFASCRGERTPEAYRAHLLACGVEIIVETIGTAGSRITTAEGSFTVPICPVPVVDTNGAGDSYNAAFLHGLTCGLSPLESARQATRVAAYAVGHMGPRAAAVSMAEIDQWFAGQGV